MKRLFDIVFSLIILLLFFPFGILFSILILTTSIGGVFYRQERIGRNGQAFQLFKFRTMQKNADKNGKLTVGMRDTRITKVGYILRRSKLDEFPQFINVLKGDMSVVGPRPEVREFVDLYTPEQAEILKVKPGITDLASLEYYKENELLGKADDPKREYIEEIMPAKIELNKKYLKKASVGFDLKIIWRTFLRMFG